MAVSGVERARRYRERQRVLLAELGVKGTKVVDPRGPGSVAHAARAIRARIALARRKQSDFAASGMTADATTEGCYARGLEDALALLLAGGRHEDA